MYMCTYVKFHDFDWAMASSFQPKRQGSRNGRPRAPCAGRAPSPARLRSQLQESCPPSKVHPEARNRVGGPGSISRPYLVDHQ